MSLLGVCALLLLAATIVLAGALRRTAAMERRVRVLAARAKTEDAP